MGTRILTIAAITHNKVYRIAFVNLTKKKNSIFYIFSSIVYPDGKREPFF